jgi:hypothetical protein
VFALMAMCLTIGTLFAGIFGMSNNTHPAFYFANCAHVASPFIGQNLNSDMEDDPQWFRKITITYSGGVTVIFIAGMWYLNKMRKGELI